MENKDDSNQSKEFSNRKRKKLYNKLRTQMEFYFSDSNLAKDKFLYSLILQDPNGFVDLEVFKSFNKVKDLSTDTEFIAESLSRSTTLEVNEDQTRVRRKCSIDISKDFDACTIYIERLPNSADQKWIRQVFENFGTVEYINIPRFKISQKIKGYAFVEFNSPESVIKACQFYQKDKNQDEENAGVNDDSTDKNHINKKRKLDEEIINSECEGTSKKLKLSVIDDIVNNTNSEFIPDTNTENNRLEKHLFLNETELLNPVQEVFSKKKKKKSKHKQDKSELPNLRVMSKSEWKNYRNKYLDLQRVTMSYLKSIFCWESTETKEEEINPNFVPLGKKELKFHPGVILELKVSKPVENPADLKEKIKTSADVAFVDTEVGSDEVFVRCHTAEAANSILEDKKLNSLGDVVVLTGLEEENYWKKIWNDRESKLNNPEGRKRSKKVSCIKEQKNRHTYFDE